MIPWMKYLLRIIILGGGILLFYCLVLLGQGPHPDDDKVTVLRHAYVIQVTNKTCKDELVHTCLDYLKSSCCMYDHGFSYYEMCSPDYPWCPMAPCPFIDMEDPTCASLHRQLDQERCLTPPLWVKNCIGIIPYVLISCLWSLWSLNKIK